MKHYVLDAFGLENLHAADAPQPQPGPGEILLDVRAISLNYRDLLVIRGSYNPKLTLPAVPLSDAAGVVVAMGPGVSGVRPGDHCMTHYLPAWESGRYRFEYLKSALGTPGPGMAAEQVLLPAAAFLPMPKHLSFAEACTLPIAGLTAWSALVTVGNVQPGQTVLTLGTGGVALFTLQIATALGARVIITSSSDEKLARARGLGAWGTINYRGMPAWESEVLRLTDGAGADLTVETGGAGTLNQSLSATRAAGTIAFLGALSGLQADVRLALLMMKRIRIEGVVVGSRAEFERCAEFVSKKRLRPVISRRFAFDELPAALAELARGEHFGKIVVEKR